MKAIYKKELKSYFTSITACLFIAANILASGISVMIFNFKNSSRDLHEMIMVMAIVFIVTISILVMRSFAEEKHQKTDQLLFTTPISIIKIVLGKFLAIVTIYLIPIIVMCAYPLILNHYGDVNFRLLYTNIIGLTLYGLVLIVIAMFISALTEMQVIAATASILVLAASWAIGFFNLTDYISKDGNFLTKILDCIDLYTPLENMFSGLINLKDIVFYVTLIFLFIFLTYEVIQKKRWSVSFKTIGFGVYSMTLTAIVIAIVVFINIFTNVYTEKKPELNWDVTSEKVYGISEKTEKMLSDLDQHITFYVTSTKSDLKKAPDLYKNQVQTYAMMYGQNVNCDINIDMNNFIETLNRYKVHSKKIDVKYIDSEKNPNFALNKGINENVQPYSLIVYNEDNKQYKSLDIIGDIFVIDQNQDASGASITLFISGYDAEGQIDSSIATITAKKDSKAYFTTGHEELSKYAEQGGLNNFQETIKKHNASIDQINLATKDINTDNCQLLVIYGAQKDFSKKEAKKIIAYLNEGGKAIVAFENYNSIAVNKPNLYSILKEFNIKVDNGILVEKDKDYIQDDNALQVLSEDKQGYGENVDNYVASQSSIGLSKKDQKNEDDGYIAIASSSKESILKSIKNLKNSLKESYQKGDKKGPFDTVLSISKNLDATESSSVGTDKADTKQANMLVFASAYTLTDSTDNEFANSGTTIVNNALDDYLKTKTEVVSVPVKSYVKPAVIVPSKKVTIIAWTLVVGLPLIVLLAGVIVWAIRRKK